MFTNKTFYFNFYFLAKKSNKTGIPNLHYINIKIHQRITDRSTSTYYIFLLFTQHIIHFDDNVFIYALNDMSKITIFVWFTEYACMFVRSEITGATKTINVMYVFSCAAILYKSFSPQMRSYQDLLNYLITANEAAVRLH